MIQQSLRERVGVLPVHEVPAVDLFNDVIAVEHPGGVPIIRGLSDGSPSPAKATVGTVIRAFSDALGIGESFR